MHRYRPRIIGNILCKNYRYGSRSQQQKLIKSARNQTRKYSAKIAGRVLLKSIFTWADMGIIGYYTIVGYSNRYG